MVHVPEVRASLPSAIWRPLFPVPAMPWFGIRLAEYEPSATRNAVRRQDREPAPRHVEGHDKGQVGVPAEAIPHALEDLSAAQAAV